MFNYVGMGLVKVGKGIFRDKVTYKEISAEK